MASQNTQKVSQLAPKTRLNVFNVKDIPNGKPMWNRIGSAFVNGDGSVTVVLDALPMDGRLVIRVPAEKDAESGS